LNFPLPAAAQKPCLTYLPTDTPTRTQAPNSAHKKSAPFLLHFSRIICASSAHKKMLTIPIGLSHYWGRIGNKGGSPSENWTLRRFREQTSDG
jgi:hypothetical protein